MSFSPNLGRWLQQDPIGYAGGSLNLYLMEGDNPINRTDPEGTDKVPAPTEKVIIDWIKRQRFFRATVKRWCGNCFKITIYIEYEDRLVKREGKIFDQWRNLKYTEYTLGEKVPCTGKEIGELTAPGKWKSFTPPWKASGEKRVIPLPPSSIPYFISPLEIPLDNLNLQPAPPETPTPNKPPPK